MAELKHRKQIVTELKVPEHIQAIAAEYATRATRILYLDSNVVESAPFMNSSWYWKATEKPTEPPHTHDFDEVIGFFGSDPQNPRALGGEVEFWLEDEKYILTQSCLIFVPRGTKHCPLWVTKLDRPILFIAFGIKGIYDWNVQSAE